MSNIKTRRVTVVMSDQHHTLQLIEVMAQVRQPSIEEPFRVDRAAVEEAARMVLVERGLERSEDETDRLYPFGRTFDFVGVLVAHDDTQYRGRITWATEVETQEAVTI